MRKHLFLTCALVLGMMTSAFCAEKYTYTYTDENGELKRIYLEMNTTTKKATVISGEWEYTGKIVIPDEVEYPEGSGTKYQITTIGKGGDANETNSAFYYCYDLDEVVFGANVTTIKENAFYRCGTDTRPVKAHLESDGLTTIETNAFNQIALRANYEDNTILLGKNITQFGPKSATSKDNWHTWGNMINVTAFKVADGNTSFSTDENGVLYNYDKTTLISFPKYRNIATFTIPEAVTTVRSYAFYKMNKLRTVNGGDKVVRLGSVISGLTSLRMGPKLTDMSSSAFMYCGESFEPVIAAGNTAFVLKEKVLFKYEHNPDKVILCWFLRGNQTEHYVIPEEVTDIPYGAFYPNKYLKTIEFPENTKLDASHINKDAFIGTVNSIEFTGAGVGNIYNNVDGVWYSSDYKRLEMYGENVALEHFVMQDATTTLPRSAVKNNKNVKIIEFNKNLSSFDSQDFYKWENLEEYRVKTGNGKLWADTDGVLYNSTKTKVVAYPRGNTRVYYKVLDGTTNIGTYAFYKNKYLKALDLGKDIQSVVESNCNNLAEMDSLKAIKVDTKVPPTVTTSTFTNKQLTSGNIILYVPDGETAEIYQNASIWNRFTIVQDVELFESEIRNIDIHYKVKHLLQNPDDEEYTVYETNNRTGKLLSTTEITPKTDGDYVNYEAQPFNQIVLENNGLTVEIKYCSKPFTITWMNGSTQIGKKTYHYRAHFYNDIPGDQEAVAGQHFVGWGTSENATVAVNFKASDEVTQNITYYAIFADNTPTQYVVNHYKENADNDEYTLAWTENMLAPFGSQTKAAAKSDEESYKGFTAQSFSQQTIAEDGSTVVEIRYNRNEYPVTWMNGETTIQTGNYKYDYKLKESDVPEDLPDIQYYRFHGWNTVNGANSALTVVGQTVPLNGVIYYAVFVETGNVNYTIKHVLQELNGSYNDDNPYKTETGNGQIDSHTSATANSYPGFTAPNNDAIEQQQITETGATVIIHYTRNRYDVVWKNGDDVFQTDESLLFGSGIEAPENEPVAEAGKHFVGWNTNKNAESALDLTSETVAVNGNIYYAIFADNATVHYTVKHYKENLDGTYPNVPTDTEDGTGTIGLPTAASAISATDKEEYNGFTPQPFEQVTIAETGTVVTIKYNRNIHTLTWHENEGNTFTGNYTKGDVKYGAPITVPTATREGYTLLGWNTSNDPTEYSSPATTMPNKNLTYYAIWKVNQYHAAYYYNNPEHPAPGKEGSEFTGWNYNFNEKITAPNGTPNPADYDGHHSFVGWSKESTGNNIITNDDDFGYMTTAGAKFYAIWKIHSNTLTWDANGGDALTGNYTSGTVDYDTEIIAPNTPTREGYTFMGWATSENGTPAAVDETMPDYELNYYAIWQINSHNIAWNRNANDDIALEGDFTTGTVNFGTTIVKPNDPERIGYDFKGWATSTNATTAETVATTMPDNDLTYYAVWEVHKHQLTWYPNGGEFTNSDPSGLVDFGTEITTPLVNRTDPDPEIEWKCAGWGLSEDTKVAITPASTMPDEDLTYYAIWILKKNAVTWKRNHSIDDDLNVTATHVDVGVAITAPINNPTREHYQFQGWSATRDGVVIKDNNFGIMDDSKKEFYAIWQINSHSITWHANDGTGDFTTTSDIEFGTTITKPDDLTRTGYTFMGWALTSNSTETVEITTMPDNDVTYYAVWKANTYDVVWKYNNGTNESFDTTQVAFDGTIVAPSTNPTRDYHRFIGWSESSTATEATEDLGTLETEGATFYAVWQLRKFNLTWDANGGELSGEYTQGEVAYGTEIIAPTATMENFLFGGWGTIDNPNSIVTITTMPDSSITFVANWTPLEYAVEWRMNDGTDNNYISTTVNYGNAIVAPETDPKREHYQFLGWSGTNNGDVTADFGTMDSNHKIFYAQWQINSHTLAWNANGGELSGEYTTGLVEYGVEVTAPEASRTGYTLSGWGTYAEAPHSVDVSTMPDNNIEYFALWTPNTYNVVWKLNDGSDDIFETTEVAFGNTIEKPANPSRDNYQFAGWAATTDGEVLTEFGTMDDVNGKTFFAQWMINSHTLAWNANGGELSGDYTAGLVEFGTTITTPEASRTGHTFKGWGATATATENDKVEITTMPDADVEYFAIWNVNSYTAKWHFDQDSVFASTTFNYGDTIKAPSAMPERAEFNFLGWAATETGTAIDSFGLMPAADTAFFAVWEAIEDTTVIPATFTATWLMNNGTDSVFIKDTLTQGDSIAAPAKNPEREQFSFVGWSATADGEAIAEFGKIASDTAFYALWKAVEDTTIVPATFIATWLMNNGTDSIFVKDTLTQGDSIAAPAKNPEREQFTFAGWSATADGEAIAEFGKIASDTAFYALWKAVEDSTGTFIATWYMNNGTDSIFIKDTLAQGDSIAAPAQQPEREGYSFLGWSAAINGSLVSEFGTIVSDTAFYAVWLKNKCLVTWMLEQNKEYKTDTLAFGDAIHAPTENPEREHYVFKGWAMAGDSVIVDFGTAQSDETVFYAVWQDEVIPQYIAIWYYNDGSNSAFESTNVDLGATILAPSGKPNRDNYIFKGWSVSATGSVTTNFGTMSANGAAFYAIWEPLISFTAPEIFNSCESGSDHIELKDINNSQITFEWNVNGDIDSIQTDGYFEFTEEMALSGTIEVTGILGDTRVTKTINYQRNNDMMRTMWDDVITVVNGKGYFQSYRWYQNGVLVDTTDMHYEKGGLTGTYKLVAVTTDSLEITSCEMTFGDNEYVSISAYPNPVVNTVLVKGSDVKIGNRINIVDSDGKVRLTKDVTDENGETINMSNLPQGVYIVKVGTQSVSIIKL